MSLSIMVSLLDAKELLDRLAVNFGSERGTLLKEIEDTISEIGIIKNSKDAEPADVFGTVDQEVLLSKL